MLLINIEIMKTFNTIGIGEILWDLLPTGKLLGGAPTNFAYHTQQLGAKASVISAVGNDAFGREILEVVNGKALGNYIVTLNEPTGTVTVELNDGEPSYSIHEGVAWDAIQLTPESREALLVTDAICFGSLAQRSTIAQEAIYEALKLLPRRAVVVFDMNLRQHFYTKALLEKSLAQANVLKVNDEELVTFTKMIGLSGAEEELIVALIKRYDLDLLALTKGDKGSYLATPLEVSYLATPKVEVVDTIGAGDSFTAAMVMGLLNEKPLRQVHQEAVEVSAFVCTQKGATPELSF